MEKNDYFSEDCKTALELALKWTKKHRLEYITIDAFMMYIAQTPKGREIFEAMKMNVGEFVEKASEYLLSTIPKINDGKKYDPVPTLGIKVLRNSAVLLAQSSGVNKVKVNKVDEGFLLAAIFQLQEECFTLSYFESLNVLRFDIMSYVAHKKERVTTTEDDVKETKTSFLQKYAINLNQKAKNGNIDTVFGREKEVARAIEVLGQRRKNNPLFVAEPGVGKTAIAEGLAKKISEGDVPESIKDFKIYSLDMTAVLAGTKYRGDFEERMKGIISEASKDSNVVLFIDEIHTLIGSGAASSGTMDASNMLKPALSSGELKVIGATTYEEYRKYFAKEGALARRFQKIDVEEPSHDLAYKILQGVKAYYQEFHKVIYTDAAIKASIELSVKYINDRRLPDKAIDILDTAGSRAKLSGKKEIGESEIKEIVASIANIPVGTVDENDKNKLRTLEDNLKKQVFGQDEAVARVVDNIIFARANIMSKEKPIGSFIFAGPSGVGKTELAKQIAQNLGVHFHRIDMSEYMEKHTVARLVGAPPGYVGYEQGGLLTEEVRKNPYCVLLLDEVEKAHKDIFNILLQVMDYGSLTDSEGKKADFKNVIIIMTTNLGSSEINKPQLGFSSNESILINEREKSIKNYFSPEFYNRLDGVIHFQQLSKDNILEVVNKQVNRVIKTLLSKHVVTIVSDEVYAFIAENGYDDKLGVRPIERFIETNISRIVAREILFGKLENGGEIKICVKDEKLNIDVITVYDGTPQAKPSVRKVKTATLVSKNDTTVKDILIKKVSRKPKAD